MKIQMWKINDDDKWQGQQSDDNSLHGQIQSNIYTSVNTCHTFEDIKQ